MNYYKTLNGWTKDKMRQAILRNNNGTRAVGPDGACKYITEDGNRCAVGCFIPDELLEKARQHQGTITELYQDLDTTEAGILEKAMPLKWSGLELLQVQHDVGPQGLNAKLAIKRVPELESDNVHTRLLAWIDFWVEDV